MSGIGFDSIPYIVKVCFFIDVKTDQDVIRNALGVVCETGLSDIAVVNVARPPVRLDADGNVDLRHIKGAADVAYGVIVPCVLVSAGYHG